MFTVVQGFEGPLCPYLVLHRRLNGENELRSFCVCHAMVIHSYFRCVGGKWRNRLMMALIVIEIGLGMGHAAK